MGCGASAQKYIHDEDKVIVEGAGVTACNGVFKRIGVQDGKPKFKKIDGSGERIWFCAPERGPYGEFGTWFLGNPRKTNGKATYYVRCPDPEEMHPPLTAWKPWIYGTAQSAPGKTPALYGDAIERAASDAVIRRQLQCAHRDDEQHTPRCEAPTSGTGESTLSIPLPPHGAVSTLDSLPAPMGAPHALDGPAAFQDSERSEDAGVYPACGDGRIDATPESRASPTIIVETPRCRNRGTTRIFWPGESLSATRFWPAGESPKTAEFGICSEKVARNSEERTLFRHVTAPFSPAIAGEPMKAQVRSPETLATPTNASAERGAS